MSYTQPTSARIGMDIADYANAVSKYGDQEFTLACAVISTIMQREDDYELLQQMAAGDDDAFDLFVERHDCAGWAADHVAGEYSELAQNALTVAENAPQDALSHELGLLQDVVRTGSILGGAF